MNCAALACIEYFTRTNLSILFVKVLHKPKLWFPLELAAHQGHAQWLWNFVNMATPMPVWCRLQVP